MEIPNVGVSDFTIARDMIDRAIMDRDLYGTADLIDPNSGVPIREDIDEAGSRTYTVNGISITRHCMTMLESDSGEVHHVS